MDILNLIKLIMILSMTRIYRILLKTCPHLLLKTLDLPTPMGLKYLSTQTDTSQLLSLPVMILKFSPGFTENSPWTR